MHKTLMPAVAFLPWAFDVSLVSRCGSFALVLQPNNQLLASPFRVLGSKRTEEGMGASQSGPDRACSGHWIERMNSCQGNECFRGFLPLGLCKEQAASCQLHFCWSGNIWCFWEGGRALLRRQQDYLVPEVLGHQCFFVNNAWNVATTMP